MHFECCSMFDGMVWRAQKVNHFSTEIFDRTIYVYVYALITVKYEILIQHMRENGSPEYFKRKRHMSACSCRYSSMGCSNVLNPQYSIINYAMRA